MARLICPDLHMEACHAQHRLLLRFNRSMGRASSAPHDSAVKRVVSHVTNAKPRHNRLAWGYCCFICANGTARGFQLLLQRRHAGAVLRDNGNILLRKDAEAALHAGGWRMADGGWRLMGCEQMQAS